MEIVTLLYFLLFSSTIHFTTTLKSGFSHKQLIYYERSHKKNSNMNERHCKHPCFSEKFRYKTLMSFHYKMMLITEKSLNLNNELM